MPWIRSADPRWQRGAAAVEMAIIMPLLLLFIAGIVDFGRFFLLEIQMTNAVREGARAAIVSPADVTPRVLAAAPFVDPANVSVTPCAGAGTNAEVTATDPTFTWILLDPALSLFGGGVTLLPEAKAVMRCEG